MNALLVASLAVVGLAAGYGQRAVVFRYAVPAHAVPAHEVPAEVPACAVPAGQPPGQGCPACGHRIAAGRWRLPLALALSGRCPACRQRTGPPPLAVELTTALLLAALAARVHPALVLAAACWLALCAVPLAFIDAAVKRLPDELTGPAFAGTALLLLAAAAASGHWHVLARAMLGGIALVGFYLVVAFISPSGMGMGDVKAAAGLGTLLAWQGWTFLLAGTFAGFLFAAIYGIALLLSGRATRKRQIPFGPFMLAAAFLVLLLPTP